MKPIEKEGVEGFNFIWKKEHRLRGVLISIPYDMALKFKAFENEIVHHPPTNVQLLTVLRPLFSFSVVYSRLY